MHHSTDQMMYREFMRENDERERLHRDRVHKTVAEMSDKAQEQFAKVLKLNWYLGTLVTEKEQSYTQQRDREIFFKFSPFWEYLSFIQQVMHGAENIFTVFSLQISANLRNPNVPDQERWERVLQLYGKMEPELRNEFEQKFKGFPMFSPAMVWMNLNHSV